MFPRRQTAYSPNPKGSIQFLKTGMNLKTVCWVAVKELELTYRNIVDNRVSSL